MIGERLILKDADVGLPIASFLRSPRHASEPDSLTQFFRKFRVLAAEGYYQPMPRCAYTETCVFFNDEVGYSIDLQASMRLTYCMDDYASCARYQTLLTVPREQIPDDLIPTDESWALEIVTDYVANHPAGAPAI
ncbi:MAG: hypothetical protein CVT67_04375 [Actinobacteria bacterium HGW-Actinobacteria-7]|nr:MAG: hypothetical protein CVT67_04375 [Actinobacteria bacterium HGW-Actinobacteria-7]